MTLESELALRVIHESGAARCVIFLHGVNGHWQNTWSNHTTGFFWPQALGQITGWQTLSVQYDANTNWRRTTMPLQERAVSIAELLLNSPQLEGKDIAIVAHSFGGIVTKQVIRRFCDYEKRYRPIRERVAAVVFVATPHSGAQIATYGHFLRWALKSTVTLEDLRAHSPLLSELAEWYRNADTPESLVLYETRKIGIGWFRRWLMVVDRDSANPGVRGANVIPIDADHFEICRPSDSDSVQVSATLKFLKAQFEWPARLARYPRQAAAVCFRRASTGAQFLLVRTTGKRWTFPKGQIEEKLGLAGSAAREALEEAGVRGTIEDQPFTFYVHGKREWKSTRTVDFAVAAFLLEVFENRVGKPEPERSPTWCSSEEAKALLSEGRSILYQDEFRRVVDMAVQRLARQEP